MPTHVYANGLEIVCGASDGVASTAFPDPCASPPGPPAGPVIVPYSNVAYPQNLTNGSCTVFIGGEPVALEDQSYFATSTGNEAATQAFGQGVISGATQGKAYFRSWSLTVMIEGKGVARHTDLVTHNHGSFPANTPMFPYVSRGWFDKNDCKKEETRIERACKPEIEDSNARKKIRPKNRYESLLKQQKQQKKPKQSTSTQEKKPWHWTDDHCHGLDFEKVRKKDKALAKIDEIKELVTSIPDHYRDLLHLEKFLTEMASNAGKQAFDQWLAKARIKQTAGSVALGYGRVAMAVWSLVDAALAAGDVVEILAVAEEGLEQVKILRQELEKIEKIIKNLDKFDSLSAEEKRKVVLTLFGDAHATIATLNPCTRARKCILVPYDDNPERKNRKAEPASKGGCCRSQTGHHLIPKVMINQSYGGSCDNYNHSDAPTVCVEGVTQYHGTHGLVHDKLDESVAELFLDQKFKLGDTMNLQQVIDAAVKSHAKAFPLSSCSRKCIKVQLENYYKNICPDGRFATVKKDRTKHSPHERKLEIVSS